MAGNSITLNYSEGNSLNPSIPRFHDLDVILIHPRTSVVIFGEGNFSHTVALHMMRRLANYQAEPVVGTCLDDDLQTSKDSKRDALEETKVSVLENYDLFDEKHEPMSIPHGIGLFDDIDFVMRRRIDAMSIPAYLRPTNSLKHVYWFQCPWASPTKSIPDLLTNFLASAFHRLHHKDMAIIGIANHSNYVDCYDVPYVIHVATECIDFRFLEATKHL